MLIKNLKTHNIKAIVYVLCSLLSFYFFLKISGKEYSRFHELWSFMFFSWSLAIISEIKFQEFMRETIIIQGVQQNINLIMKLVTVQIQFLSMCVFFFKDSVFLLLALMSIFILFHYVKTLNEENNEISSLRYIKNLNLFLIIGFLCIFLKFSFTGAIFIILGMAINYFSINLYNSKVKIFNQVGHRELYNMMQLISLIMFYRGGAELPAQGPKLIY
tara:strand:+ start:1850 stop:2500 length:651 start_codon:yes stop_codon:yes gene_type:complete